MTNHESQTGVHMAGGYGPPGGGGYGGPPGGYGGPPGGAPPGGGGYGPPGGGGYGGPPGGGGYGGPPGGGPPGYGGPPGGGPPGYGGPPGGPPGYGPPPGGYGPPGFGGPPGYGPPGGGYPMGPGQEKFHPLAITSLVLGILSIPMCCCSFLGVWAPIAAVVCGIIGLNKIKLEPHLYKGGGFCIAGIATGGVGLLLDAVAIFSTIDDSLKGQYGHF